MNGATYCKANIIHTVSILSVLTTFPQNHKRSLQKRFDIGWQRSQFLLHYLNVRTRDAETFTVSTTSLVAM